MEANYKYTVVLVSSDNVYVKAISILIDLFYKSRIYHFDSLSAENLTVLNSLNPEFVIVDYETTSVKIIDLQFIKNNYPGILLCRLDNENSPKTPIHQPFHHLIGRQYFMQNFNEAISKFLEHITNSHNKPQEEIQSPIKPKQYNWNLYNRLFKKNIPILANIHGQYMNN